MQWRCGVCCLALMVFFGVNLLSEELLQMDDGPREPSPSFNALRAQPSAEIYKGSYTLRSNSSSTPAEYRGVARMTLGTQQTSTLGVQISSISVTLVGAERHIKKMAETAEELSGGGETDIDLVLRGVELLHPHKLTASGVAKDSPLFAAFRRQHERDHLWKQTQAWPRSKDDVQVGDLRGPESILSPGHCRLDAILRLLEQESAQPPGIAAASPVGGGGEGKDNNSALLSKHSAGWSGRMASTDCGFSLCVLLNSVNIQHTGEKVTHYALWVILLTVVQMQCFITQMRYTENGPSAAKLSMVSIAIMALMDAYDSFLHLTLTASSQYMFNTFAMISLSKFILFSLVEVRYLLTIWRCQHRDIFAAGWDEVRRHVSRLHSYFYGALFGGLIIVFNALEYLDVFALIFQAYWVPQILHDVWHGSKASYQYRFLVGISATRCLALLYLWGCPSSIFSGDLYPSLPRAPNSRLCLAAVLLQVLQLAVMVSQQMLGPRWFVPRLCLPHVYSYQRVGVEDGGECVICMGELEVDNSAITPCDHRFHKSCLERWMDVKMECPTCRAPLPPLN